jgi:hypothetical protein
MKAITRAVLSPFQRISKPDAEQPPQAATTKIASSNDPSSQPQKKAS